MKKPLIFLFIFFVFISCKQNNRFHVNGTVKDAAGEMLYFEHNSLMKTILLDSVKLGTNGEFSFKSDRPVFPDFYDLRLNTKIITFAVDSCENINFKADENGFSTEYEVTGSETSLLIQKLRKSVMDIQRKADALRANLSLEERNAMVAEIETDIEQHKEMARKLILQDPRSLAAYFAIYQQVNKTYLFSPYVKTDKPYCAAVATSFNAFMPEYERTKNLYSLVMDAIKTERNEKQKEEWNKVLENDGIGYIDIALKDKNNVVRKISDLKDKVILIDFSTYDSEQSVNYTFSLRELYNKYHKRGFEIYQVSLDKNKLIWEQSIQNIPWICVRDENGSNTTYVSTYNISSVPTTFLINNKGSIVARNLDFETLNTEIEKNL